MNVTFANAIRKPAGPRRTAAVAAWVQGLYPNEADRPILVGGAAVVLYTGGAYVTGDLDFVGDVPPAVASALKGAGFVKKGRHWIHEASQIFLEFPATSLAPGTEIAVLEVSRSSILTLSPEEVVLDRLQSLVYWKHKEDGINAFLVTWRNRKSMDWEKLQSRSEDASISATIRSLQSLVSSAPDRKPGKSAIKKWIESSIS